MANRYWVGGSGSWSDASNHWASTSGGSGAGVNLPTINDDVYFNAQSFDASGTITLDISANCKNFDWTGLDSSVWFLSSVQSAYIYGDISLNTNLQWRFSGTAYVYLWGLDTSRYIYSNNSYININRIYMEASGATYVNVDDWAVNNTGFYLSQGTWDTNSKTIRTTSNYNNINTTVGNLIGTKKLSLGSSDFYCNTFSESGSSSGFTLDASNSTIYCIYVYSYWQRSYNNIVITPNTAQAGLYSTRDTQNYNNVTFTPTTKATLIIIGNHNINNLLTLHGNDSSLNRLFIISSVTASTRYIYSSDVSCSNIDFADISVGGTANWDLSNIPGGSGDCGGNYGISFTPETSCYFVHTSGTCDWFDSSKWFTSSGGTINSRIPLPQDNIVFDENSFTGSTTLSTNARITNADMSNITFPLNITSYIYLYGKMLKLSPLVYYGNNYIYIYPYNKDVSVFFDPKGARLYSTYTRQCIVGLHSDLISINSVIGLNSTFYGNAANVSTGTLGMSSSYSCYFGSGTWKIGTMSLGGSNFNPQNSTIIINGNTSLVGTLYGAMPFNKLVLESPTTTIIGKNSYNELIINPGSKVLFPAYNTKPVNPNTNSIQTIIGKLIALGTSDASIYLGCSTDTSTFQLDGSFGNIRIQAEHCFIKNSTATPNNRWYARNSTDLGGNSGWNFKEYSLKPIRIGNKILNKHIEK